VETLGIENRSTSTETEKEPSPHIENKAVGVSSSASLNRESKSTNDEKTVNMLFYDTDTKRDEPISPTRLKRLGQIARKRNPMRRNLPPPTIDDFTGQAPAQQSMILPQ
jgi:hypothetical protein